MNEALAIGALAGCASGHLNTLAQAGREASWTWSAQLSVAPTVNDTDWSRSHTVDGGGSVVRVIRERLSVAVKRGTTANGRVLST